MKIGPMYLSYIGMVFLPMDIFNKCGAHVHIKINFKETCNTKNVTFHGYFHCVKFHFDRSKGKKIHFWGVFLPGFTHLRFMRINIFPQLGLLDCCHLSSMLKKILLQLVCRKTLFCLDYLAKLRGRYCLDWHIQPIAWTLAVIYPPTPGGEMVGLVALAVIKMSKMDVHVC